MRAERSAIVLAFPVRSRPSAALARCAACATRTCCSCSHWVQDEPACSRGHCLADHRVPATSPRQRCTDWRARPLAVVGC